MVGHADATEATRRPIVFESLLPPLDKQAFESPSATQRMGYAIANPFKNQLIPAAWLQKLMKSSPSPLVAESFVSPGGWRSMEYVYRNQTPLDWIDGQALRNNPICMAARNRRKMISGRLTELIKAHSGNDRLTLLGVGSGPGWHIQTAIKESKIDPSKVTAYLIDLADDSFEFGRAISNHLGIADSIHFVQGDARQIRQTMPDLTVNIAKLVGILEYLTDEQASELFNVIHQIMVPGGYLVTHGFVDRYGTRQFLARVFDLRHHQRNDEQLKSLLSQSGFEVRECEYEPTGIHPIVTAVRRG